MRKYLIFLVVSLFLAAMTVYLVSVTNPLEETAQRLLITSQKVTDDPAFIEALQQLKSQGLLIQYLNWRSILPVFITAAGAGVSLFIFVHMILDKLFWKKFYEQPSVLIALRRGVMLLLAFVFYLFCQLYAVDIGIFGLGALFLLLIEIIVYRVFNARDGEGEETNSEISLEPADLLPDPSPAPAPQNTLETSDVNS